MNENTNHFTDRRFPDLETRFILKVDVSPTGCWMWQGSIGRKGYGAFGIGDKRVVKAHRYAYERFIGPIPKDKVIDHLCRNRSCVNPNHLEPVTNQENIRRGFFVAAPRKECKRGHALTKENIYVDPRGYRCCIACRKLAAIRFKEKKNAGETE